MRWPRGRYNGRRIVGVRVNVVVDVTYWALFAMFKFTPVISVGPVRLYWAFEYEH